MLEVRLQSGEISCTKLSGKTPTLPFNSPFHQPLSGRSLLKTVMTSPSFKSNSSSLVGMYAKITLHCSRTTSNTRNGMKWNRNHLVGVKLPGFGGKLGASFSPTAIVLVELTKSSRELFKLVPLRAELIPLLAVLMLLLLRRLANIGDALLIAATKFDGNTPILPANFPRHHPSSTSPKNSMMSPTARVSSSLLFCV